MRNQQAPADKPVTTRSQTYAYCTGSRHGSHRRIATFDERGQLAWCKSCHQEVVITWAELERIRLGFQHRLEHTPVPEVLSLVKPTEA